MTRTATALNDKGQAYVNENTPANLDAEAVMSAIESTGGFMGLREGGEYMAEEAGTTFTITSDMVRWE